MAERLIEAAAGRFDRLVADRGYDADAIRAAIARQNAQAVIPSTSTRRAPIPYDRIAYRARHQIERLRCRLKDWRRVATRYDKLAANYLAGAIIAATILYWFRSKDDILCECVRLGLERLEAAAAAVETEGGAASGLDRLTVLWTEYAHIVTEDFGRCLILVGENPLPPQARKELRTLKSRIDRRFRSLVEAGIADGSIRPCDPRMLAFAAAGALSWIARWYDPAGPLTPDIVARETIGFLVEGIRGTVPSAA